MKKHQYAFRLFNQSVGSMVHIDMDCRKPATATGKYGVLEGEFPRTVVVVHKAQVRDTQDHMQEFAYDEFMAWNLKQEEPVPEINHETLMQSDKSQQVYFYVHTNPRIRLDDGSVIWGDECWWQFGDSLTNANFAAMAAAAGLVDVWYRKHFNVDDNVKVNMDEWMQRVEDEEEGITAHVHAPDEMLDESGASIQVCQICGVRMA